MSFSSAAKAGWLILTIIISRHMTFSELFNLKWETWRHIYRHIFSRYRDIFEGFVTALINRCTCHAETYTLPCFLYYFIIHMHVKCHHHLPREDAHWITCTETSYLPHRCFLSLHVVAAFHHFHWAIAFFFSFSIMSHTHHHRLAFFHWLTSFWWMRHYFSLLMMLIRWLEKVFREIETWDIFWD